MKRIVQLDPSWHLWEIVLPDGRRAEVVGLTKRQAAEQGGAVWSIPASWLLERAEIVPVLPDVGRRSV